MKNLKEIRESIVKLTSRAPSHMTATEGILANLIYELAGDVQQFMCAVNDRFLGNPEELPKEVAIEVAEDKKIEKTLEVENRISGKTFEDNKGEYPGYLIKEIFVRFKTHMISLSTKEAVERTAEDYKQYPSESVKECIILAAFG